LTASWQVQSLFCFNRENWEGGDMALPCHTEGDG
jgi:hypothetical protein